MQLFVEELMGAKLDVLLLAGVLALLFVGACQYACAGVRQLCRRLHRT